jgi:hypothetical protein
MLKLEKTQEGKVMLKSDVIKFYGTRVKVARAAGIDPSAVSQWGELVPEKNAARLQLDSDNVLKYDPEIYRRHAKAKRAGELNNENQSSD